MSEIARDNHYVPQSLVRRWSLDGQQVHAYRILASHAGVPEWECKPVRSVAFARDLYTKVAGGQERDDFEKWIEADFETPGFVACDRLVRGVQLSPGDWRSMILLYAAQCVRTPTSYLDFKEWCGKEIQPALDKSIADAIETLSAAQKNATSNPPMGRATEPPAGWRNEFLELLRVKIGDAVDDEGRVQIRAEITAGRRLWLAQMRHLLHGVAETLCSHRWSVWTPHGDEEWPLTDHPALRVNYNGPEAYSVHGGWGFQGSDLMMPVSPRHLLHVRVGVREAPRVVCTQDVTHRVQRLYAETALRWIFGTRPYHWVAAARPRVVDPSRFEEEEEQWRHWHDNQTLADLC